METPAKASQTNGKSVLLYTWQAQPGWVGEYGISKPTSSLFPWIFTAVSISQTTALVQVYCIS